MRKPLSVMPEAEVLAHELWKGKSQIDLDKTVKAIVRIRVKENVKGFLTGAAVATTVIGVAVIKTALTPSN